MLLKASIGTLFITLFVNISFAIKSRNFSTIISDSGTDLEKNAFIILNASISQKSAAWATGNETSLIYQFQCIIIMTDKIQVNGLLPPAVVDTHYYNIPVQVHQMTL